MIEVKRKSNESVDSMLRRFSEILKKEGILELAKEKRFFKKKPNRRQRKKDALYRIAMQKKMEYLKKYQR
ncbi:MAG: 30S ribosomal protein S21 [Patescibacteria group bacterium]